MYPELGFQEFRTAKLVAETLSSLELRVRMKMGKTGVVGYLGEDKPVLALRAAVDALPIHLKLGMHPEQRDLTNG